MSETAKTRELADGVVEVFLPLPMRPSIINVYLVRGGASWTLIDTGMNTDSSRAAFHGALEEVGIGERDVTRLVCTHHHVDHYGTSGPMREAMQAEVYLHPYEAERAQGSSGPMSENPDYLTRNGIPAASPDQQLPDFKRFFGTVYSPATPDHLLADDDEISLGDGRWLEVIWTPGHTGGHCCLLLQPDGILFVGDHLLPKITPHVGLQPGGPQNPLGDFLASHEKIQKVDARMVCPAHGRVYYDHRHRARQLIDFHKVRMRTMLEALRRPLTPYEVALEAFAISPDNRFQVMAATSETLAHLELLRHQGKVLADDASGVVRYRTR